MRYNFSIEVTFAIKVALPNQVKTISIFEEFDGQLALTRRQDPIHVGLQRDNLIINQRLVRAFASKTHNLEHISISFMIDARHFFDSCQQSYTWHHLRSLTLTSSILTQKAPEGRSLRYYRTPPWQP